MSVRSEGNEKEVQAKKNCFVKKEEPWRQWLSPPYPVRRRVRIKLQGLNCLTDQKMIMLELSLNLCLL